MGSLIIIPLRYKREGKGVYARYGNGQRLDNIDLSEYVTAVYNGIEAEKKPLDILSNSLLKNKFSFLKVFLPIHCLYSKQ